MVSVGCVVAASNLRLLERSRCLTTASAGDTAVFQQHPTNSHLVDGIKQLTISLPVSSNHCKPFVNYTQLTNLPMNCICTKITMLALITSCDISNSSVKAKVVIYQVQYWCTTPCLEHESEHVTEHTLDNLVIIYLKHMHWARCSSRMGWVALTCMMG